MCNSNFTADEQAAIQKVADKVALIEKTFAEKLAAVKKECVRLRALWEEFCKADANNAICYRSHYSGLSMCNGGLSEDNEEWQKKHINATLVKFLQNYTSDMLAELFNSGQNHMSFGKQY